MSTPCPQLNNEGISSVTRNCKNQARRGNERVFNGSTAGWVNGNALKTRLIGISRLRIQHIENSQLPTQYIVSFSCNPQIRLI